MFLVGCLFDFNEGTRKSFEDIFKAGLRGGIPLGFEVFVLLKRSLEDGVSVGEGLLTLMDREIFMPLSFVDKMSRGYLISSFNLFSSVVP